MCLRLPISSCEEKPSPHFSDKDIVCYKVLVATIDSCYITPWMWKFVPNKCIHGKKDFRAKETFTDVYYDRENERWLVGSGAIHTYGDKPNAKDVFECVIPAGTPYYVGTTESGAKSYASSKIRFVKKA